MKEKITLPKPLTFEEVWAILQETAQSQKEFDQKMKESRAESEKNQKAYEKRMAEYEKKSAKYKDDYEKRMAKYEAEYQKRMAKYEVEHQKRMAKMEDNMGNWSNNHGSFAEEYFFNSFENEQQNFFGEHFNEIEKNLKVRAQKLRDEYDIVMYNDFSVAIVETKFKAHEKDIPKLLKKAETFRILCPDYKDYKIYLGLASLSFYPELEQECIENGIAVIKQVGDTVIINDENLKVF